MDPFCRPHQGFTITVTPVCRCVHCCRVPDDTDEDERKDGTLLGRSAGTESIIIIAVIWQIPQTEWRYGGTDQNRLGWRNECYIELWTTNCTISTIIQTVLPFTRGKGLREFKPQNPWRRDCTGFNSKSISLFLCMPAPLVITCFHAATFLSWLLKISPPTRLIISHHLSMHTSVLVGYEVRKQSTHDPRCDQGVICVYRLASAETVA